MKMKRHTPEQIVRLLARGDVLVASGKTVDATTRELGISTPTWYLWKKQYGTMTVEQLQKLKELEKENARLKQLLAEAELSKAILKDVAEGKF